MPTLVELTVADPPEAIVPRSQDTVCVPAV